MRSLARGELIGTEHTGTGKTHTYIGIAEEALAIDGEWHVITNVKGVLRKDGTEHPRIHYATRLSTMFRTWAQLPEGARAAPIIDEPESQLGAGAATKQKASYRDFRYLTRKMRITQAPIFHKEEEILKAMRDEKDDQVHRLHKQDKQEMVVTECVKGVRMEVRYTELPALRELKFLSEAFGTFTIDLDIHQLHVACENASSIEQVKTLVLKALEDPALYLDAYRPDEVATKGKEAEVRERQDRNAARLQVVRQNPTAYLGTKGQFDRSAIKTKLPAPQPTFDEARALASDLQRLLEADVERVRANRAPYGNGSLNGDLIAKGLDCPHEWAGLVQKVASQETVAKRGSK